MKKVFKRLSVLLLSILFLLPLLLFVGCNRPALKDDGSMQNAVAESQYGFVNKIGNYIYFINGAEEYQADNKYGKVVKGALMRLHVNALPNANRAEMVVPELVVSADYKSGLLIHNGYIYYASPNATKNLQGQIEKDYLNFKSAKLDGTNVRSYARAGENKAPYRYSIQNNKVYLTYLLETDENNKEIHVVDTTTGNDSLLVRGYDSAILAEDENANAKYVYYTMQVAKPAYGQNEPKTYNKDSKDYSAPEKFTYRQLYRVDITGEGVNTAKEQNINTESLRNNGYKAQDNTVLDYCNQGELLYDGIPSIETRTIFNAPLDANNRNNIYAINFQLLRYISKQNYNTANDNGEDLGTLFFEIIYLGGPDTNTRYVYAFTEKNYADNRATHNYYPVSTPISTTTTKIDFSQTLTPILLKTQSQSTSILENAVFSTMPDNSKGFAFIKRSGSESSDTDSSSSTTDKSIQLNQVKQNGSITHTGNETFVLTQTGVTSDSEALFIRDDALYYNANGSSGKKLYKVTFKSGNNFLKEQTAIQFLNIEYKSEWYKPEILNINGIEYLFFANASTYGENYINLLDTSNLATKNQEWEEIQNTFTEIENTTHLQEFSNYRATTLNLVKFYFYTGLQLSAEDSTKFADRQLFEYYKKLEQDNIEQSVQWAKLFIDGGHIGSLNFSNLPKNAEGKTKTEQDFYKLIGERSNGGQSRQKDIATALLPTLTVNKWTWQWWAIFVPVGVAVAGGATFVTLWLLKKNKVKNSIDLPVTVEKN